MTTAFLRYGQKPTEEQKEAILGILYRLGVDDKLRLGVEKTLELHGFHELGTNLEARTSTESRTAVADDGTTDEGMGEALAYMEPLGQATAAYQELNAWIGGYLANGDLRGMLTDGMAAWLVGYATDQAQRASRLASDSHQSDGVSETLDAINNLAVVQLYLNPSALLPGTLYEHEAREELGKVSTHFVDALETMLQKPQSLLDSTYNQVFGHVHDVVRRAYQCCMTAHCTDAEQETLLALSRRFEDAIRPYCGPGFVEYHLPKPQLDGI